MDYTDIILSPVVTEKSSAMGSMNVYCFKVKASANKNMIKKCIEDAFGVKVKSVNTLNTKPKDKRVGKHTGQTKTYKKAMVTLQAGQAIEM